jgi:predicted FMN-binding regulatory protein PaiB
MYLPKHFTETDPEKLFDFIKTQQIQFLRLVGQTFQSVPPCEQAGKPVPQ